MYIVKISRFSRTFPSLLKKTEIPNYSRRGKNPLNTALRDI
jgi:hypothetical protein